MNKYEEDRKDKTLGNGKGKGKMRNNWQFDFNAIEKALTPKEQQHLRDEHLCYKYHKHIHPLSKFPMLRTESADNADKHQD
jgi:hypothetical protein